MWDPLCPACGDKMKHVPHKETHANPPNQYAITKLAQEMMALTLGRLHGIPSAAMRYSIVHGGRQTIKNAYSGALRIFSLQMINNEPPSIYEDGKQLRDYVHAKDVALANVLVMETKDSDFKAFNVGGKKAYTVLELAKTIAQAVDYKGDIKPNGQYRVGDTRHSVSDLTQIKKLGWSPQYTETQAIEEFLSWIKKHKKPRNASKKARSRMLRSGVLKNFKKRKN
jgi:dTDP-L-rhamnose 4-epimerase